MRIRTLLTATMAVFALAAMLLTGVAAAAPQRERAAKKAEEPLPPIETAGGCEFITNPAARSACCRSRTTTTRSPTRAARRGAGSTSRPKGRRPTRRPTHRSRPVQRLRRLQPRLDDPAKIPGINTAADVKAMNAVPINKLQPVQAPERARRGDRRVAPGSAGRSGSRSTRRRRREQSRPRDPPGRQLHLRAPLHRRAAQPQERGQRKPAGARRLPLLPRRTSPPNRKRSTNGGRTSKNSSRRSQSAGIERSSLYLAWDFTVASDANNTGRELSMRNDAFAQLGDTNLADGIVQGTRPAFEVTKVENEPNPGQIARRVKGNFTVPVLPVPRLRAGRHRCTSNGEGVPDPERDLDGELRLHHPAVGDDRTCRKRRDRRCTGTACSGTPPRSPRARSGACRRNTRSSSARPTRSAWPNRTFGTVIEALENVSAFPTIPDRLQQGLLDELYLGRAMINPAGFDDGAGLPPGRHRGDGLGAQHEPPVLQRQQPGRDHGRRADGGLARLHPRIARRAGDELLGAACRARSTSTNSLRCSTRTTRAKRRGRWCST